ncbi:unnamed protein product [Effrenium voratum]|uniref:PDZ domain-containing protein n=1 Tax=Effrenium voratum TaxID=2562239 RepID=A0AA36HUM3_9DINO|nr:unnamed protein product [Effrenium voratum]
MAVWFFGLSGLMVLNSQVSKRWAQRGLRIKRVDEATGLSWTTLGAGESPAYADVVIVMDQLPKSRLGINLVHKQRKVSRVVVREAFNAGWRVGDEVLEVEGKQVRSNAAAQRAVRRALKRHARAGGSLKFKVRRWAVRDGSRGMLQLTKDGHREHLVPMVDIVRGVLKDYQAVLFMEGTLQKPNSRLSRLIIRALDAQRVAFKAIDCSDEKANPGIRKIAKEVSGEEA